MPHETRRLDRANLRAVWDDVRHRQATRLEECAIYDLDQVRLTTVLEDASYSLDQVIGNLLPELDETEPTS